MQKSWHVSHKTVFAVLSFSIPIVVSAYGLLHPLHSFSSEFVVSTLICIGIVLGAIGLWKDRDIRPTMAVKIASLMGIILNIVILYLAWGTKPTEFFMTGTIMDVYSYAANESSFGYERSLRLHVDLPAQEPVERNVDPRDPIFIVNITGDTVVYKQTGNSQKRVAAKNQLQEDQHVRVEWAGYIWITDPAQVDATSITILNQ